MSNYLKYKHVISKLVIEKQTELGINNKKLALYLNIPQYKVVNIRNSEENLSIQTMTKLENILNILIF